MTRATLGSYIEVARRPYDGLIGLYRRHGPVVEIGGGPFRYTYLLGPEANQFVFANSDLFRWREAFEFLVPVDGETALIVTDGPEHKRRRRLVQPAFHGRQIASYVDTFRRNADQTISSWRPGTVINVYDELRRTIRRSTIELLFGSRLAADEAYLGQRLQVVLDLLDQTPVQRAFTERLRLPSWRRSLAAKAEVDARVYEEIAYRRSHPDDSASDVLSTLIAAVDEDGGRLTDEEIRDQVISLIAAGYETTSAAMAWLVAEVVRNPGLWDDAAGLPYDAPPIAHLVSEALRLHPPAALSARYAAEEFELDGQVVRAGTLVLISPYVTHRLAEVWPDPVRYDPSRWDPAAAKFRKAAPHEFLPFGGGPHRCIGATFALTELQVILAALLRRTVLVPEPQEVRPVSYAAMRPRGGVRVRVQSVGAAS